MNKITKDMWLDKLNPIHKHFSKKVYAKIKVKLANLITSLKKRSDEAEGSVFNVTKQELEYKLFEAYGKKCPYCNARLKLNKSNTIDCDHIVPLADGGNSTIDNLQFICHVCNRRKDTLSHEDFVVLLKWLDKQSDRLKSYVLAKLSKRRF